MGVEKLIGQFIVNWQEFKPEFEKRLNLGDQNYLEIVFATALAHRLPGDPLWLFWVAPSGGGKTEVLRSFRGVQDIKYIESLSEKGLVSHFYSRDDKSLARLIDNKCLVIKDLTTLLEARSEIRKTVFSQLRGLYDGEFDSHTGVGGKSHHVKFGVLAGVTPIIEESRTIQTALGERFLFLKTLPGKEMRKAHVRAAMRYSTMQPRMRKELRDLTSSIMESVIPGAAKIKIDEHQREWFVRMAELLAQLRAHVPRDKYGSHDIVDEPVVELATRLVGQLMRLFISLRTLVNKDDSLRAVARVVKDSIPTIRIKMVEYASRNGDFKIAGFESKISKTTLERYADDLVALEVFEKAGVGIYKLLPELKEDVRGILGGEKVLREQRPGMWE